MFIEKNHKGEERRETAFSYKRDASRQIKFVAKIVQFWEQGRNDWDYLVPTMQEIRQKVRKNFINVSECFTDEEDLILMGQEFQLLPTPVKEHAMLYIIDGYPQKSLELISRHVNIKSFVDNVNDTWREIENLRVDGKIPYGSGRNTFDLEREVSTNGVRKIK